MVSIRIPFPKGENDSRIANWLQDHCPDNWDAHTDDDPRFETVIVLVPTEDIALLFILNFGGQVVKD